MADELTAFEEGWAEAKVESTPLEFVVKDSAVQEILHLSSEGPKLLEISSCGDPLVSIDRDGTVTIHRDGGEKEAAEIFYECLAKSLLSLTDAKEL